MGSVEVGRLYKHSKSGKLYKIKALAKHSETLEDLVVYEAMYNNNVCQFWVRPLVEFLEIVDMKGKKVLRFEKI